MRLFDSADELRSAIFEIRHQRKSIGLVPTMGALHEGHLSLAKAAKTCDIVVVSVFVNPLQFNHSSDLENYPRALEDDLKKLEGVCDIVFAPDYKTIYKESPSTTIDFGVKGEVLEGKFRPEHFEGVGLVVSKFFNIVQPDRAYFGLKDLQQYLLVKQMVKDLSFPVEIIGCPTVREASGLAMSSRNRNLSNEGKIIASKIFEGLKSVKKQFDNGISLQQIKTEAFDFYNSVIGLKIEYLKCISDELEELEEFPEKGEVIVCIAAIVENVRLIDNLYLRN